MQRLFFTLSCILIIYNLHAQALYGTASDGGDGVNSRGTITKLVPGTNLLTEAYTFDDPNPDGKSPLYTDLVQGSDGKLYSMTANGGVYGDGIIFSYNPATSAYTKLKDFDSTNGATPGGSLLLASDGKFYGTTAYGGSGNYGTIFSINPANPSSYTKLKDLDSTNGAYPFSSLIQATDGKLYGMTYGGGSSGGGVIFSFNPANSSYTKLQNLDSAGGYYPRGSLLQASNGKLYGMTLYGGKENEGVIFSFTINTGTYTKLFTFTGNNGGTPYGSLMQASDGKLYGLAYDGGGGGGFGDLFSFNISNNTFTKLKIFDDLNGANPFGKLMQAADGKLYGTTNFGGTYDRGVIFSYNISTANYTKLYEFSGEDGANPHGTFLQTDDGTMYSLTRSGGAASYGTIFSFKPATATLTRLKVFGAVANGTNIVGGLVKDAAGKLYGMFSNGGGIYGYGGIYSFDPATTNYTKLFEFNSANGANPQGSLLLANDNKLYGMTYSGGSNNGGVIFSFNPANATYTKLKELDSVSGRFPQGSLVQATDGKLYGMTAFGGSNNAGVLFSLNPGTSAYTKLVEFNGTNGANPRGTLVQATDGRLYGMTTYGGSIDAGVIFSYNPATATYTKLWDFAGSAGVYPHGSLVQATNGKLYGMTYSGGNSGVGTIFSFNPSNAVFAKLKDFDLTNGRSPRGTFVQAADGKLYGMTNRGGSYDYGTAFSFAPGTAVYTKLADFDGTNGKYPVYTAFVQPLVAVTLKINNVTKPEGNSGTTTMSFTVTLSASSSQTVTVNYKTQNNTAAAPSDYVAKNGTLTFAPGVKKQTIAIVVNGDTQVENDEKFKIILNNAVNATIADSLGIGTVQNDDGALTIKENNESIVVAPNPATSMIKVQLYGFAGRITLQVTNASGKVLKTITAQANNNKTAQQTINVADIASGTYFITASDTNGNKRTEKIIITH